MTANAEPVKIRFSLEVGDDGWPPVGSEGVWAAALGGGLYRLDNTPWFARGVAYGDVVEAMSGSDGIPWATKLVHWNGHLTIRVIPFRDGPLTGDLQAVLDAFAPYGVTGEGAGPSYAIVALDVPPDAPLRDVKSLLREGQADGRWEYEEGCVSDEWEAL